MTGFFERIDIILLNTFPPICPHCFTVATTFTPTGIIWTPEDEAFETYTCKICLGRTGVLEIKQRFN